MVDDNVADVKLLESLFKLGRLEVQLRVARDGEEALRALKNSPFEGKEDPDLILLDLSLPKIDGQEVLEKIKSDPSLKQIQVLILTGSQNPRDRELAKKYRADGFLTKAKEAKDFSALVKRIEDFWLDFKGKTA